MHGVSGEPYEPCGQRPRAAWARLQDSASTGRAMTATTYAYTHAWIHAATGIEA